MFVSFRDSLFELPIPLSLMALPTLIKNCPHELVEQLLYPNISDTKNKTYPEIVTQV